MKTSFEMSLTTIPRDVEATRSNTSLRFTKTYLWSIFFNLLNLLIFNLLSSKGIKGAQLCPKVENNISFMSQMHYVTYME